MHNKDIPKIFGEELASDPATVEAYRALKGLYPKSDSETRKEDRDHLFYLQAYIYDTTLRMKFLRRDHEASQNRTFMEKLKDLFSK